jgi:hypothetical protein
MPSTNLMSRFFGLQTFSCIKVIHQVEFMMCGQSSEIEATKVSSSLTLAIELGTCSKWPWSATRFQKHSASNYLWYSTLWLCGTLAPNHRRKCNHAWSKEDSSVWFRRFDEFTKSKVAEHLNLWAKVKKEFFVWQNFEPFIQVLDFMIKLFQVPNT